MVRIHMNLYISICFLLLAGCVSSPALQPFNEAPAWLEGPVEDVVDYLGEPTAVLRNRWIWERARQRGHTHRSRLTCRDGANCTIRDASGIANLLISRGNYRCSIVVEVDQERHVREVKFDGTHRRCATVWRQP